MTKLKGTIILIGTTVVALSFSMAADMTHLELGALSNLIIPPLIGVCSIVVFLVTSMITFDKRVRIFVVLIFSIYLLYVGLAFYFGKEESWVLVPT